MTPEEKMRRGMAWIVSGVCILIFDLTIPEYGGIIGSALFILVGVVSIAAYLLHKD